MQKPLLVQIPINIEEELKKHIEECVKDVITSITRKSVKKELEELINTVVVDKIKSNNQYSTMRNLVETSISLINKELNLNDKNNSFYYNIVEETVKKSVDKLKERIENEIANVNVKYLIETAAMNHAKKILSQNFN